MGFSSNMRVWRRQKSRPACNVSVSIMSFARSYSSKCRSVQYRSRLYTCSSRAVLPALVPSLVIWQHENDRHRRRSSLRYEPNRPRNAATTYIHRSNTLVRREPASRGQVAGSVLSKGRQAVRCTPTSPYDVVYDRGAQLKQTNDSVYQRAAKCFI
jgi:hypothetical protein